MSYKKQTDEALMRRVCKGDEKAFNEIYARYSQRILLFLYKMLSQDEAKAQDFLQDVFVKIASDPQKFDPSKNFKTWVFTVAANLCKNYFRSNSRKFIELSENQLISQTEYVDAIDRNLFTEQLNEALNELNANYKEVFVLRYFEGLSMAEIAQVANCPVGTVKSRLHSATRNLAQKLTHYQPH